ncbi:phosphate ABC transporter permease [Chroococcidiopsis sp. FACHB-1243]|uniref:phosphate ABC transporter permease n=1 Tax=Chroococcidiopsis sp. [FACHB-1243] TaxID=2692781 RepID=UPI001785E2BE|nr:phosphate ABC transporter permease [Chroococcidiopsis sp. [FACHB-1243]]MBD2309485.1 phosphate ABC transporter permease [Chroococcidiopsis sp. [FACHB-1243]]
MLVPLTRQKFEQLIPRIATGDQYRYVWGKFSDFLRRLLASVVAVVVVLLLRWLLGEGFGGLLLPFGVVGGFYWLWGPVLWASLRNAQYRKYKYSGFFRGRILDVYISEELIGREETVNNKGELVYVDNLERRLNVEVGDETGFSIQVQVPLRRSHKGIARRQVVEMIVLSNRADLSNITKVTDIYIPSRDIWVSDYPFLQRDVFVEVSNRIRRDRLESEEEPRSPRNPPQRKEPPQLPRQDREW